MKDNKTLLITGGLGYIGSHGVIAFAEKGYKIVIVDNLSNTDKGVLDNIEKILGFKPDYYECDLRNKSQLEEVFKKYNFDGVLHFAGLKSVGESCEKTSLYLDNNIGGSMVLFTCMEKYNVKNIIFSSSATVYDYDNPIPYIESMPTGKTTNPYAYTKYNIELLLRELSDFSGFRVINLRYFNPIGAHESGLIGENPKGIPNNLLPCIMKVASGELKELRIFGSDYDTTDGTGVRDYIDVNDLIEGHILAYELLESVSTPGYNESINLGLGKGFSVLEVLDISRKITGRDICSKMSERRKGDIGEFYCDASKAKRIINWEAKTGIEESIKNSWNFYNQRVGK